MKLDKSVIYRQEPSPREAVPVVAITFQKRNKKVLRVSTVKVSVPGIFYAESRSQN